MVKICQTGLLKLNFETRPKKRIFRVLPKISAGHGWSWNFFFANFQTLGPLGCQGWVVIPQNVKTSQNHCTLMYSIYTALHARIFTLYILVHIISVHILALLLRIFHCSRHTAYVQILGKTGGNPPLQNTINQLLQNWKSANITNLQYTDPSTW